MLNACSAKSPARTTHQHCGSRASLCSTGARKLLKAQIQKRNPPLVNCNHREGLGHKAGIAKTFEPSSASWNSPHRLISAQLEIKTGCQAQRTRGERSAITVSSHVIIAGRGDIQQFLEDGSSHNPTLAVNQKAIGCNLSERYQSRRLLKPARREVCVSVHRASLRDLGWDRVCCTAAPEEPTSDYFLLYQVEN